MNKNDWREHCDAIFHTLYLVRCDFKDVKSDKIDFSVLNPVLRVYGLESRTGGCLYSEESGLCKIYNKRLSFG